MNTKIGFPVQIIQSWTLARGLRPPYSVTRRFNGHTNAKKLIPPSGRTDSNEALATKDQLHRVELGLIKEISGVREGLTKEISSVESRLADKMSKNHAELLVAIQAQNTKFETQNTKFESFKLHVYRLIGSVVAAAIGIANRDKIMQGLSSSIKP